MILCTSLVPSQGKIQVLRCDFRLAGRHIRRHNFRLLVLRMRMQFRLGCRLPCLWLEKMSETSVKIIKNEVRCRDDTVPKTVDTRKHCKVGLRACNNFRNPLPTSLFFGVTEDCCMLSTLPCSAFLYLQFLARCHPYILLDFYTCILYMKMCM